MVREFLAKFEDVLIPACLFIIWKCFLFFTSIFALIFIPLYSENFLGGGVQTYNKFPLLFSWINFDGEHFLSIAFKGFYSNLEHAFFPFYPFLTYFFSLFFPKQLWISATLGIIISNLSFLLSLIFLTKLLLLDYPRKVVFFTLIFLLVFPFSFYFNAFYSESLFLLLSVLCFYFSRKDKWFLAGIFGGLASLTRIFGAVLFIVLLIESWHRRVPLKKSIFIAIIPLGLLGYMIYLYLTISDPIAFYSLQTLVGEQHQRGIVFFPQILFRYLKILATTPLSFLYQTIIFEFFVGVSFLILLIFGFVKKIRYSYFFYSLIGFFLTTIQGSFSSLPRYVIVLFPFFLIMAIIFSHKSLAIKILIFITLGLMLFLESSLFLRGYWIA